MPDEAVREIVARMKATARAHASIPVLPPPRGCYYEFANGRMLCLTVDVLTAEWVDQVGQRPGVEVLQGLAKGAKFWHLSITRVGASSPLPAEVEFWRGAFFEEPPFIQTGRVLPGVNSRHFFWKYE